MRSLFDPDSLFYRILLFLTDLVVLNVLFLLTCLPVFTIGPSLTALYTVAFRLGTPREGGVTRDYFRAFRANFRQGVILGLLATVWVAAAAFCLYWAARQNTATLVAFGSVVCLGVMTLGYVFPLLSRFDNTCPGTLKNAMLLCLGHLPRSIVVGAVNVLPVILILTYPATFFELGLIWLLVWFSASAYGNCRLLAAVFAPYLGQAGEA